MTAPDVSKLIAAQKLIEKPEAWCQSAHARDATGQDCFWGSRDAMKFDPHGAIYAAGGNRDDVAVFSRVIGGVSLPYWNDAFERTHAEVFAAFDRAINAARGEA